MIPTLPHADPDQAGRASRLDESRDTLRYSWDRPAGVATATEVPRRFGFSARVVAGVAASTAALKTNRLACRARRGLVPSADADAESSLASCQAEFATITIPPIAALLDDPALADRAFAWQRVAGPNPTLLQRVDGVPEGFLVTDAMIRAAVGDDGDGIHSAGAEGRLFLCSFHLLHGLRSGAGSPGRPKRMAAPLALFVRPRGGRELTPVAIQSAQEPGPESAVLTPRDGTRWTMAKVAVQTADLNVQELYHHLGRSHFLMEAVALATERRLSSRHPVHILLAPHLEGTLAINGSARDKLLVPGAEVENLLAPTLEDAIALVRRGVQEFDPSEHRFDLDLRRRGVDTIDSLPSYPWRDDAAPTWRALRTFVGDYLRLYAGDEAVIGDVEIQAWLDELRADDGGRLGRLPARVGGLDELADLVATFVFVASVQHASLNYSQLDFMGYPPNMPGAAYAYVPADGVSDASAWARVLPPQRLSEDQLDFFYKQSGTRVNRLGEYNGAFFDPRVRPLVQTFQQALRDTESVIVERNRSRLLPYPYLQPSLVPASIHI